MIRLELIGNLTRDPETRTVQKGESGGKVCNFTVAASVGYGDYKRTEFVRIAAWNGLGETCLKYLRKGSKVFVSGTPAVNTYVNNNGEAAGNLELRLEEVEFLSNKPADSANDPVNPDDEDIEDLL